MRGDIDGVRHHRAVQALIEQQVGAGRNVLPGGEGAGRLVVGRCFQVVVQVFADLAHSGLAIAA